MNKLNRQAGVLIFLTPFLLVVIAVVITLGMDAARLSSAKSKMQSIVNAASTAAADEAQACGVGDLGRMKERALVAARRAGFDGTDEELEVFAGVLDPDASDTDVLKFSAKHGSAIQQTNAAAVRYTRQEPISSLLPTSLIPPVELSVNSAARKELYAVMSANASTVNVRGGLLGNLLGAVLGQSNYNLDPTDLKSLESTLIGVGDLLTVLGVKDVASLLDKPLVTVLDGVTSLVGGVGTPVGALVDELTGAAGISGLDASAVLKVVGEPSGARNAQFPLFDFVISTVMNSASALNQTGSGLIDLAVDTADAPVLKDLLNGIEFLADIDLSLKLGVANPAQVVIGPARQGENGSWLTEMNASDISLEAAVDVKLVTGEIGTLIKALSLGFLGLEVLDDIRVPLVVKVGGGKAEFVGARCARGSNNDVDIDVVVNSSVAKIETGSINPLNGAVDREPIKARILKLTLLDYPVLGLCLNTDLAADLPVAEKSQVAKNYNLHCAADECRAVAKGGGPSWVEGLEIRFDNLSLDCGEGGLAGALSKILDSVLGVLVPIIEMVLDLVTTVLLKGIISPLLMLLGVDLSGLQVTVIGADQLSTQLIENVQIVD